MTRAEIIEARARELIKEGKNPEDAFAIAIIEQSVKDQEAAKQQAADQKAIGKIIEEGRQTVDKLKDLHERLESDVKEQHDAEIRRTEETS